MWIHFEVECEAAGTQEPYKIEAFFNTILPRNYGDYRLAIKARQSAARFATSLLIWGY